MKPRGEGGLKLLREVKQDKCTLVKTQMQLKAVKSGGQTNLFISHFSLDPSWQVYFSCSPVTRSHHFLPRFFLFQRFDVQFPGPFLQHLFQVVVGNLLQGLDDQSVKPVIQFIGNVGKACQFEGNAADAEHVIRTVKARFFRSSSRIR